MKLCIIMIINGYSHTPSIKLLACYGAVPNR